MARGAERDAASMDGDASPEALGEAISGLLPATAPPLLAHAFDVHMSAGLLGMSLGVFLVASLGRSRASFRLILLGAAVGQCARLLEELAHAHRRRSHRDERMATRIQSGYRGRRDRKHAHKKRQHRDHGAAVRIQAGYRGRRARRHSNALREERRGRGGGGGGDSDFSEDFEEYESDGPEENYLDDNVFLEDYGRGVFAANRKAALDKEKARERKRARKREREGRGRA